MADPEGVHGVRSNPPLWVNYSIFMGIYLKSLVKLTKRTPFVNLNPLSRNPGSTPEFHGESPWVGKHLRHFKMANEDLLLQNQNAYDFETEYVAFGSWSQYIIQIMG